MIVTAPDFTKPDWVKPLPMFDHAMIYKPFIDAKKRILIGLKTKIEAMPKSWEQHLWFIISTFVETSFDATDAVCTLVGEKAPVKYATPALCVSRGIFEALFNVAALLDDPRERYYAFRRDEYATMYELYRLRLEDAPNDPGSDGWLHDYKANLDREAHEIGLSPADAAAPPQSFRWPTPGYLKKSIKDANKKHLLDLMYKWHYFQLSAAAHFRQFALMAQIFAKDPSSHWEPGRQASNQVSETLMFFAALLSEVELSGKLGANQLLREGWTYLAALGPAVSDFYNARYKDLIPST